MTGTINQNESGEYIYTFQVTLFMKYEDFFNWSALVHTMAKRRYKQKHLIK